MLIQALDEDRDGLPNPLFDYIQRESNWTEIIKH
jgi:hypothetical protein